MRRATIILLFLALGLAAAPASAQQLIASTGDAVSMDRVAELAEVKDVIDRFGRMWEDENMEEFATVVSQDADIVIIGTDEAENWIGYAAYRDARKRQFESFDNVEFNVYDQRITLSSSGNVAWFSQKFDLLVIAQGTPVSLEGIRLTGVLEKRRGYWQIVQLHNSVPVLGQAAEY